jgi:ABC-type Fe3+-siderophore transport system permease subunit
MDVRRKRGTGMKKKFMISLVIFVIVSIVSYLVGGWELTRNVNIGIGVVSILLAAVFSGAFISGDRMRANHATQTSEDRTQKNKWTETLMIFSFPFLLAAIILYYSGH